MEVFVLSTLDVIDFDDYSSVEVFSTKEKAKKAFDKYVSNVKKSIKGKKWVIEESEDEFYAFYEYGCAENYVRASVQKLEVE